MYNEHPRRTGVYHIRDNIEQLELQVHVRHVNSLLELPSSGVDLLSGGQQPARNASADAGATAAATTTTRIRWQEKILSGSELELYQKASNCATDTQKHYHHWLQTAGSARVGAATHDGKKRRGGGGGKRAKARRAEMQALPVFTYVQADHFTPSEAQLDAGSRPRALAATGDDTQAQPETMYVYLEPATQLACLRWQAATRTLLVYPDFNGCQDDVYFARDTSDDCCRLHAYVLEHVSRQRAWTQSFGPEVALAPLWQLDAARLGADFDMPPKHQRRVTLLLQLHAAHNCAYDGVHVRYHAALPEGALLEHGRLAASTHTASDAQSSGRHHFGHTWQLTLLCDERCQEQAAPLRFYFQLISVDSWQRERVEGYAYYAARLTPGRVAERLQCLRPVDGVWDALARYFIGGRRPFDFVRFFTPPQSPAHEDRVALHNRLGCRMQSTAQLDFSFSCVTQRTPDVLQPPTGAAATHKHNHTLDDIMLAYQTARRKLEALLLE